LFVFLVFSFSSGEVIKSSKIKYEQLRFIEQ